MKTSQITLVSDTADIVTYSAHLREVVLTAGADAATATIRAGGASGTVILVVNAALTATVSVALTDVYCAGGIHVTITGTTPSCSVVYS